MDDLNELMEKLTADGKALCIFLGTDGPELLNILDDNGWSVDSFGTFGGKYEAELEWTSPLCEEFTIDIIFDGSAESFRSEFDLANSEFSPDLHVRERLELGSTIEVKNLLEDAENIAAALNDTNNELYKKKQDR